MTLIPFGGKAPRVDPDRLRRAGRAADRRHRDRAGSEHLVQLRASRRRQPDPDRRAHQHPGRQRPPRRFAAARQRGRPSDADRRGRADRPYGDGPWLHPARPRLRRPRRDRHGRLRDRGRRHARRRRDADPGQAHPVGPALGRAPGQICPRPRARRTLPACAWASPIMSRWPSCTPRLWLRPCFDLVCTCSPAKAGVQEPKA